MISIYENMCCLVFEQSEEYIQLLSGFERFNDVKMIIIHLLLLLIITIYSLSVEKRGGFIFQSFLLIIFYLKKILRTIAFINFILQKLYFTSKSSYCTDCKNSHVRFHAKVCLNCFMQVEVINYPLLPFKVIPSFYCSMCGCVMLTM